MKRLSILTLGIAFLVTGLPATTATEKFEVRIEIGEHPYLPGYEFGRTGALGDLWILEIEVLDSDGDPAEGAKVRIYNGKKSLGSGYVDFNGIAKIKLALTKLGVQNLRIVAIDNDPSGKGEASFQLEVVKPQILRVQKKVIGIHENYPDDESIVLDGEAMVKAGCTDMNKLWGSPSNQSIKMSGTDASATWPFNKSKRKFPLNQNPVGATIDAIIRFQNTTFPLVDDYSRKGYIIVPDDLSLPVDWQILCQADSGALLILN
jgi:hypothetical protein